MALAMKRVHIHKVARHKSGFKAPKRVFKDPEDRAAKLARRKEERRS